MSKAESEDCAAMSREFPDFVDPWRLADGRKEVGGTIPLARFERLRPLLAAPDGDASFRLRFSYDAHKRAMVDVEVSAALNLVCQRSLEPYAEPVRQRSQLLILAHETEQAGLSDQKEFVLVDEGRLAVADLVEDELLLAVPQVPKNPELEGVLESTADGEDDAAGSGATSPGSAHGAENRQQGRQRPFESLAELMKNQSKQ